MTNWLPIRYREFWDVPRIFLVSYLGQTYLFDCPFDEAIEDYPDHYRVYSLSPVPDEEMTGSWDLLPNRAIHTYQQVPIREVRFDASKRKEIDAAILGKITGQLTTNGQPDATEATKTFD
jgi:hypothetical protein